MRDRADAADARHQAGHLVERAALREAFEAAHLRHVEMRVFHLTLVVELDGDLAVALKAGNGINGDGLAHDSRLQSAECELEHPAAHRLAAP